MHTFSNFSLKPFNTFGLDVKASKYISVEEVSELRGILSQSYASELFILGGGSNMLLTHDLDKTVLHINLKGIEVLTEKEEMVMIRAMAGENWHEFVMFCIQHEFGGLENLSLIPGNVGTTPIQNIGAYGVEMKDSFVSCTAMDRQTLEIRDFSKEECQFGYRDSVFKNELKDQFIILSVTFALTTKNHILNTTYGSIDKILEEWEIKKPGIKDVSDAVISIRRSKLPDPKELGNSGSFFKNPVISRQEFLEIKEQFPDIPFYEVSDHQLKLPAGWLIDKAGLKGYREGDAGVHEKQALVLVNYGEATGTEIFMLAKKVQQKIKNIFGIDLEPEVNIF